MKKSFVVASLGVLASVASAAYTGNVLPILTTLGLLALAGASEAAQPLRQLTPIYDPKGIFKNDTEKGYILAPKPSDFESPNVLVASCEDATLICNSETPVGFYIKIGSLDDFCEKALKEGVKEKTLKETLQPVCLSSDPHEKLQETVGHIKTLCASATIMRYMGSGQVSDTEAREAVDVLSDGKCHT